ncbi:MAG: hypothetical protein IIC91_11840, partial [Chloroflexi bacterium]|nr:hypothetical protein [Chloroflexota bacterium]
VARLLQTLPCLEDGDIDEDGAITALDAVRILQHSAGLLLTARAASGAQGKEGAL